MAGKGDKRRPREIDEKTFEDNWNRIFKNCLPSFIKFFL